MIFIRLRPEHAPHRKFHLTSTFIFYQGTASIFHQGTKREKRGISPVIHHKIMPDQEFVDGRKDRDMDRQTEG